MDSQLKLANETDLYIVNNSIKFLGMKMKVPHASTATMITSFKRMFHYMLPETRSRYTKESLQNLALTIPIHQHLMSYLLHHHCRLVCAQIQNLHPFTLPLESPMQQRMRIHQRNCYLFRTLKLQLYTVTQRYGGRRTKLSVKYIWGQSVSQSSKQRGNLRVVLEVDKVWPNIVICTLPIIPLCTYCPKLQGLVSCSPR